MRNKFKDAATGLTVVNLNAMKKDRAQYMESVLALFAQQYPDFAELRFVPEDDSRRTQPYDPDMVEDFSAQLGKGGFLFAVLDEKGAVAGLSAGLTFKDTQTACHTYLVISPDADERVGKTLSKGTTSLLDANGIKAVYHEYFLPEGAESWYTEEIREAARTGLLQAPISYRQPLSSEDDSALQDVRLYAAFAPGVVTDRERSALTEAHMNAFTRYYDPELSVAQNRDQLARYQTQLAGANWTAALAASPKPASP